MKTDKSRQTIISTNDKHTGPHPVTMRRLSTTLTPSASPAAAQSTPRAASPVPLSRLPSPCTPLRLCDTSPALEQSSLEIENMKLREELTQLKNQMQCVMEHTMESDARLLQYTSEIFVAKTPRTEETSRVITIDRATQSDQPNICSAESCKTTRDLVSSLRTTIEVLEAEVKVLRADAETHSCSNKSIEGEWISHLHKKNLKTQNRFSILTVENNKCNQNPPCPPIGKPTKQKILYKEKKATKASMDNIKKPRRTSNAEASRTQPSRTTSFTSVVIEGDSHARGLAALVQRRLETATTVSGICKPGAKLGAVLTDAPPSPGSCCVLIAGTNDVAAGESRNIFRDLERRISSRLSAASVLLATLPLRHDLPVEHPINQEVRLVNTYLEELCFRYGKVHLLDFNKISRRWFTKHGMHLRPAGKILLARLVHEGLVKLDRPSSPESSTNAPQTAKAYDPRQCQLSSTAACNTPYTLPFETYAEAVKSQQTVNTNREILKNLVTIANVNSG